MLTVAGWNERVPDSTERPVLRSDWCDHCSSGRTFDFQLGHETSPIYHDEGIKQVLGDPDPRENVDTSDGRNVD
mgnify:FL=1